MLFCYKKKRSHFDRMSRVSFCFVTRTSVSQSFGWKEGGIEKYSGECTYSIFWDSLFPPNIFWSVVFSSFIFFSLLPPRNKSSRIKAHTRWITLDGRTSSLSIDGTINTATQRLPLPSAHITLTEFSQWREALIIIIIITTLLLHPTVFALASLANRGDLNAQAWIIQSHVGGFYQNPPPNKEEGGGDKVDFRRSSNELVHALAKVAELSLEWFDQVRQDPARPFVVVNTNENSSVVVGPLISDGGKVVGREAPKNISLGVSKKDDLYWFWVF